jgi:hypothetical protein
MRDNDLRDEDGLGVTYRADDATVNRPQLIDELGAPKAESQSGSPPRRWLAPIIAAVVVVTVFAVIATVGWSHFRSGKAARGGSPAALELWASFPADASPRPLVLTGPDVIDPASGFASGGDKLAYISGSYELTTTLPAGPVTVNGQRISSAAEALAELSSGGGVKQPGSTPLAITRAELGTGAFPTDRGMRTLPAWSFRFAGVAEPALVLAIPPADRWPRPGMPTNDDPQGVSISPDGAKATLSFIGAAAGTGLCEAEYTADVRQGRTAVMISVRQLPHPTPDPDPGVDPNLAMACAAAGYPRTVTVTLQPPLGNRVLIDSHGAPLSAH